MSLQLFEPTATYVALPGDASVVMSAAPSLFRLVRPGLTKAPNTLSIMSVEKPGWYLGRKISKNHLLLWHYDESHKKNFLTYNSDKYATFTEREDYFHKGSISFQSVYRPSSFITRVRDGLKIIRPWNDIMKENASFTVNASKPCFVAFSWTVVITSCKMLLLGKCKTILIADNELLICLNLLFVFGKPR